MTAKFTSATGAPVVDNNTRRRAPGAHAAAGRLVLEKLAHFDRELIPERRMHAKGSGAYGTFTVTHDITRTPAPRCFPRSESRPRCLSRFSVVAGERGAADADAIFVGSP